MFSIICVLTDSVFLGVVESVERETEFGYERVVSVYGHPGVFVFPKGVWQKTESVPRIEAPTLEKCPDDGTN